MHSHAKNIAVTSVLAAVAVILTFLRFSVPFAPPFLKIDFSNVPALVAAFCLNPFCGVLICFLKCAVKLAFSASLGIGTFADFCFGLSFILPAGVIYNMRKTKKNAILSLLVGSIFTAVMSVPINLYILYPIYFKIMPENKVLEMYQTVFPAVNNTFEALLILNAPITLISGLITSIFTFLVYKRLSALIRAC